MLQFYAVNSDTALSLHNDKEIGVLYIQSDLTSLGKYQHTFTMRITEDKMSKEEKEILASDIIDFIDYAQDYVTKYNNQLLDKQY